MQPTAVGTSQTGYCKGKVLCRLNVAIPHRQLVFRELRNMKAINRNAPKRDVAAIVETQSELTAQQLNDECALCLTSCPRHAPAPSMPPPRDAECRPVLSVVRHCQPGATLCQASAPPG